MPLKLWYLSPFHISISIYTSSCFHYSYGSSTILLELELMIEISFSPCNLKYNIKIYKHVMSSINIHCGKKNYRSWDLGYRYHKEWPWCIKYFHRGSMDGVFWHILGFLQGYYSGFSWKLHGKTIELWGLLILVAMEIITCVTKHASIWYY